MYQSATTDKVRVGSTVYIRLQHANYSKAKVTAIVPEYGILLKVDKSTVPPWAIPYSLCELYIKVD